MGPRLYVGHNLAGPRGHEKKKMQTARQMEGELGKYAESDEVHGIFSCIMHILNCGTRNLVC